MRWRSSCYVLAEIRQSGTTATGTAMGVVFAILGPVEVTASERQQPGLAPRQRAVLAYLLLHARTTVSAERLIDAMWGETPPDTARAQVHAALTAIRKVLRELGAASSIETRGAAYVILPEAHQFDLEVFSSRIAASQALVSAGNPSAAVEELRAALAIWRGPPLADVNAAYVTEARTRLDERRLTAAERLMDIELTLGRHAEVIDELSGLVAQHPLRECLSRQLMLALHRSGRQADALRVARAFRTTLAEQQGLDPSRVFVTLEDAILRDDSVLEWAAIPAAPAALPPKAAKTELAQHSPQSRRANFLPYRVPDFAGRADELDWLICVRSAETGLPTIAMLDGMAGIGKTTLAIHAANRLGHMYPDGQLFVDLQAHTPGQPPVDVGTALEILLRQLGLAPERIPSGIGERAALWRGELADRRVLVVLDNAVNADQVRPLLPGWSSSLLLITSRRRLTDLDGVQALSLDPLSPKDALDLFTAIVGKRAEAEPIAALDVLQLCGFLPLAVRISAARLHHRPQWSVAYLAARLRDEHHRLKELATPERSVAAAFTVSYQRLESDQQRMFRRLGLHPGRDVEVFAAAALADVSVEHAEAILEDLLDTHVMLQQEPGRYTFHDLLRAHARATVASEEDDEARHGAVTRLLDHYVYTACMAVNLIYPYVQHRMPQIPQPDTPTVPMHEAAEATSWLEAEHANLIAAAVYAAERDWPLHATWLATELYHYLDRRGYHSDARTLHTAAIHASRRRGDKLGEARALIDLSEVDWRQGEYEQATERARQALALSREIGDRLGEALSLNRLGYVCWRQRDYALALEHYGRALDLCREVGDRIGEAAGLDFLGTVYERMGRYELALDHHREAVQLYREIGSQHGEVDALDNLGLVYRRIGEYQLARDHHRQALALYRQLGYRSDEAEAFNSLGEAARSMGDAAQAIEDHRAAHALARGVGNRPEHARAHHGLALAERGLGRCEQAREHAAHALDLYTQLGVPEADEVRRMLSELRSQ